MYSAEVCVVHIRPSEVVRRYPPPMTDELEDAWAAVHASTPGGWYVGRPSERP
jgi:hypothetical protein